MKNELKEDINNEKKRKKRRTKEKDNPIPIF